MLFPLRNKHQRVNQITIDFFKRVNDTFGHFYGDEVLLIVANIMKGTFRNIDFLFRFGGKEFVAIIQDVNLTGAHSAP